MTVGFNRVYPPPPVPLTSKMLDRFPFYFDSRREFFERSWEKGAFEKGSVTLLLGPRIFGKTSFINMLQRFLEEKDDLRTVYSYTCMDPKQLDRVRVVVGEMLRGGENRILVLDEMNYAFKNGSVWRKIVKLARNISQLKGQRQTVILTTSETSSLTIKEAFDVLHPGILRLPALNEDETKTVVHGVLREVTGKENIPPRLPDMIWRVSGGIPPYIRISLLRTLRSFRKGAIDPQLSKSCMFDFFDNLAAIESCIETLKNCPIETARMSDRDIALMADQFCLSCPIGCRTPSVKQPTVETALAERYGLVFNSNAVASPIAFFYNDYLGRKRFEEFSSDITNRGEAIRSYVDAYGKKEFIKDILVLLEIVFWNPSLLHEELEGPRLFKYFRDKAELIFLERLPTVNALASWIEEFYSVCKTTVYGDKGIDLETRGLRLAAETPAINSYVQCKNWKGKIGLEDVGIFHKFEMVLRSAKQVHAAILVSTSGVTDSMIEEAKLLTSENKSIFSCWGEEELTTIISSICGKREKVQEAIQNLSRTKLPTKFKGGALEFLTLKTFCVLAEKVFQR